MSFLEIRDVLQKMLLESFLTFFSPLRERPGVGLSVQTVLYTHSYALNGVLFILNGSISRQLEYLSDAT